MTQALRLNEKGECPACNRRVYGRKPYWVDRTKPPKSWETRPQRFCRNCQRSFDLHTGEQIENVAWAETSPGVFENIPWAETSPGMFERKLVAATGKRRPLPPSRVCETFDLWHDGQHVTVSVGFYPDGALGEVFVNSSKTGSAIEAQLRDWAVSTSIALQHGVPITLIRHSITREESGFPSSIIGAILDRLEEFGDKS